MATTLISTAKASNANSYVDEATATAYLTERRLHTSAWSSASEADREKALMWATQILDKGMDWFGAIRTTTQALRWPRSGVETDDGIAFNYDTIPTILEEATAELAFLLLQKDRMKEPEVLGQGFRKGRVGSLEVEEIDINMTLALIPAHIIAMLDLLGEPKPGRQVRSSGVVKLERS
jgi:hypothetical protein